MCRVRLVHFTLHDVRVPMATQIFSDHGDGDFVSLAPTPRTCDCATSMCELLETRDMRGIVPCPWHRCCLQWSQPVHCRWYWDHRAELSPDVHEDPELACENYFDVSEYYPISVLVDKSYDDLLPRLHDGLAEWRNTGLLPFPADILYSHEFSEDNALIEGSFGLLDDRYSFQHCGELLWEVKGRLREAIRETWDCLDLLALDLDGNDGLQQLAANPLTVLLGFQVAQGQLRIARHLEQTAAGYFKSMMMHARFVFAYLGRLPAEGERIASADGSYSVSREQLDLADLDPSAIIEACDGPLKQVGKLQERLQELKEILQVPKRLRRKRVESGIDFPVTSGLPLHACVSSYVTAAHIVPRSLGSAFLVSLFGSNVEGELNTPHNGILVETIVEKALDAGAIAIVPGLPDDRSPDEVSASEAKEPGPLGQEYGSPCVGRKGTCEPVTCLWMGQEADDREVESIHPIEVRHAAAQYLAGTSNPQAAHIFPYATSAKRDFDHLNRLLRFFWGASMAWPDNLEEARYVWELVTAFDAAVQAVIRHYKSL
ncbi:hypothetical protein VTK56DRAFT_3634 [Thermocarpiscus australiensis]